MRAIKTVCDWFWQKYLSDSEQLLKKGLPIFPQNNQSKYGDKESLEKREKSILIQTIIARKQG